MGIKKKLFHNFYNLWERLAPELCYYMHQVWKQYWNSNLIRFSFLSSWSLSGNVCYRCPSLESFQCFVTCCYTVQVRFEPGSFFSWCICFQLMLGLVMCFRDGLFLFLNQIWRQEGPPTQISPSKHENHWIFMVNCVCVLTSSMFGVIDVEIWVGD